MDNNYLPPNLRWPGRNHFRSYVAALLFFLNSIRIQHRMYGGLIHESYRVQAYNELIDHQKRANVSQSDYLEAVEGFCERYADRVQVTSAPATIKNQMIDMVAYNASYKVTLEFGLLELPVQHTDSAVTLTHVEVRMLMPALEPYTLYNDVPEYNLHVFGSDEKLLVKQKIWLPLNDTKWVSFSSRDLLKATKTATNLTHLEKFKIMITGLYAPPISAFMNFHLDGYPDHCKNADSKEVERNCIDYVERAMDCEIQGENTDCCRSSIPFDSEDINQFGLDVQVLTQIILAPGRLFYTFCGEAETYADCIPNKFEHKLILSPSWWYPSERLTEDIVANFTVTDCTCPSCLSF